MTELNFSEKNELLTQTDVTEVVERLTSAEGEIQAKVFQEIITETEPGTIALLLESLPLDERYCRWLQISKNERVDVLSEMRADPRVDLINKIPEDELDDLFCELSSEDLIEWSESLSKKLVNRAFKQMGIRQQKRFNLYNQYAENEVGRYADHQMLVLQSQSSVDKAQRLFKRVELDCNDSIFIVNENNEFLGSVNQYDLFKADVSQSLLSIADEDMRAIKANTSLIDAAEAIEHSQQIELPIIADDNQLIGRLTLREATVIVREHYEFQLMAQAGLDEEDDLFSPVLKGSRQRALWLGINLLTAFLASATIGLFENVLTQVVALAVLMPIVASMGGIAGSQTLTLMIRGMALGQISHGNLWSFMKNEISIALINGLLWALTVGFIAGIWFKSDLIGITIGCAILINIAIAAFAGVIIPMILQKLHQDAALSGSVILTTVTDVVGFFSFLGLASLLII